MPKIPKGVFKKTLHNPNARDASNYSIVEDLAQTPCAMSALEVLQSCLAQRDTLLAALGTAWIHRVSWQSFICLMSKFTHHIM